MVDLEALKDLRAIDGKSSTGYSLYIRDNAELASLAGLGNIRGALTGALLVQDNSALTSLDRLDGVATLNVGSKDSRMEGGLLPASTSWNG